MGDSYSIMCVDDEPAVLMTQAEVLRQGGFVVHTAADLADAKRVLAANHVDAVVLDASVCNVANTCVYEALRRLQPGLRVVLHTGNPEVLVQECVQDKPRIAKPVPPGELVQRLREVLKRSAESQGC